MTKSKNVYLQERDVVIIKMCAELGYLTSEMAKKIAFEGNLHTTRRRLLKLVKAGYLSSYFRPEGNCARKLFIPNRHKSTQFIEKEKFSRFTKTLFSKPWERHLHTHEDKIRLLAIDLLKAFPKATIDFDYTLFTQKNMSLFDHFKERASLPDILLSNENGERIRFEVELSMKAKDRYEDKIFELMKRPNKNTIYICKNLEIENLVRSIIIDTLKELRKFDKSSHSRVHVYCESELFLNLYLIEAVNRILGRGSPLRRPHYGLPDKNFSLFQSDLSANT